MVWFDLKEIGRIYIVLNGCKIIYQKLINNTLVNLTEEELLIVNKLFINKDPYILKSPRLDYLMQNNASIRPRITYYRPFLEYLENNIPEHLRSNFYTNLASLTIQADEEAFTEPLDGNDLNFSSPQFAYDVINNKIMLSRESILILRKFSLKYENSAEVFWTNFNHSLIHELFHMASAKYDKEQKKLQAGFVTFPSHFSWEENTGLNEGFTEALAYTAVPLNPLLAGDYFIEVMIVNQLNLIIGSSVLIESYFGNLGIQLLCEKLCSIDPDIEEASFLFKLIENNFQLKAKFGQQNILFAIENILLGYFKLKIEQDIRNKMPNDDILSLLASYKQFLITKDDLTTLFYDADKFEGLDTILEEYGQFEEIVKEKIGGRKF